MKINQKGKISPLRVRTFKRLALNRVCYYLLDYLNKIMETQFGKLLPAPWCKFAEPFVMMSGTDYC